MFTSIMNWLYIIEHGDITSVYSNDQVYFILIQSKLANPKQIPSNRMMSFFNLKWSGGYYMWIIFLVFISIVHVLFLEYMISIMNSSALLRLDQCVQHRRLSNYLAVLTVKLPDFVTVFHCRQKLSELIKCISA